MRNLAGRFPSLLRILLSMTFLSSAIAQGEDDLRSLIAREPFQNSWKLPEEFNLPRLQSILQKFTDAAAGIGFRFMGDVNDLFHGHVLFTADELTAEGRMRPFAILYHTQEEAYGAHWRGSPDTKYDYLDVRTRNWLQWLSADEQDDATLIANARDYVNAERKSPDVFFGENAAKEREHFTIHGKNLDWQKLGVQGVGELQWEFYATVCDGKAPTDWGKRGPIEVQMPDGNRVCMHVRTATPFIEFSQWR